jgi:hypothetical protein
MRALLVKIVKRVIIVSVEHMVQLHALLVISALKAQLYTIRLPKCHLLDHIMLLEKKKP